MFDRVHTRMRRIAAAARKRLGFHEAATRDVAFEQAFLRTALGGGVLAYALYAGAMHETGFTAGLRLAVVATSLVVLAGLWMMWWFRHHSERPAHMRYFGIAADLLPMTIGLWGAGELGVPLVGIYLWVTVGNGFRYGPRYLLVAYTLSLACFGLLLLLVPYWQEHRAIGIGYLLVLACIPLYVLLLLSRLTAQKDAALELLRVKTRFVANVSHELRTPLTGVFAVYELLRRRRLTPDESELVASLGSAIATLKSSVDAVLRSSKLEAGAERSHPRLFNLRYFLWQVSLLVRPQATAKKLAWRLEIDRAVPGTVYGDWEHLQHVLGNLINNALKFTPRGSVSLRVANVPAGVRFEVVDTGIGIPLAAQETLFDRFAQVDSSATRKYGGTGLGASIAADLVRLMGGSIGVHSAPERGSTFWVELPLADHADATLPPLREREVLLVGPDSPDVAVVGAHLTALGMGVRRHALLPTAQPGFDPGGFYAALLVMPAADAALCAQAMSPEGLGTTCPWFVVSGTCSAQQESALLNAGAAGVFAPTLRVGEWEHHLAALGNRIDLSSAQSEGAIPPVTRALHVLLADDNRSNRLLLARILQDAGHTVSMVARGDEAFDRMSDGDIDLAIVDLNMPDMTGTDVIKLYRAGEVGGAHKLPIIVFSADATAAAREESLAAGANDFLTKPVTAAALLGMIDRWAGAAREADDARATASETRAPISAPRRGDDGAAPGAAGVSLVDGERLDALARLSRHDRRFLDQYLQAAFDDLEAAMADLRGAIERDDGRAVREALHKIEGTAASIGASALCESVRHMRQHATPWPAAEAATALAELTSTYTLTKSAVRAQTSHVTPSGSR
ncbi:MAG: response regulator [Burkholderiales bacterium]|nr:response regulator [Burkholderiales bacterium]